MMENQPPQPPKEPEKLGQPHGQNEPEKLGHLGDGQKHHGHVWIWVIMFLVFGLIIYLALRHHDQAASSATASRRGQGGTVTLTTATAQKGNIGVYLSAIGTVTPVYTSSITSQVSGIISSVSYREGQTVQKGAALIDIDPRIYQAQLTQAEGTLEKDSNVLAQAQMDLERYRAAWARNAIAKQILDDQEKLVLQDQGTVKNDQGVVDYDQVQLGWCHITAPFSGRVGLRLVDPGNVVQANSTTTLAVITQMQPITVIFTLAETYLGEIQTQMRKGVPLPVYALDSTQNTPIATGKLLTIDNQIDTTTGTVRLRAQFDNRKNELFPNEFVNTRLLVNTLEGVTLIPDSTIQRNGQATFVYVIANNTATMRTVTPGVEDSGNTVVQGVNPGEVLANSSFEKLQSGAKVKVVKTPPSSSGSSESPTP
jgi:multidrug efflux system membrane fusion protein